MSEQSDKVADKILEQYGLGLEKPKIKEEADELPVPKFGIESLNIPSRRKRRTKFTPDNTKRKTPYTPKPVTSARDWVHQFGEVQPHMYNKPFFDKACGDMKKMAKFDGIEATYSKEDWEYLVKMLSSQVADMIESAGFTYKGNADTLLGMQSDIQRMLQTRFRATDIDGKQYDVKVEGNL